MKKAIIALFSMLSLLTFSNDVYSPIYPTTVTIDLSNKENVKEFRVFNTSDKRKNYDVSLKDVDNFGDPSILNEYVKVFPKIFSLNPGEAKIVRVMLKQLPQNLRGKGEYRGSILVKGLSSTLEKKYASKDNKGISTSVDIQINVSMGLYVLTGNLVEKIEINNRKKTGDTEIITLKNKGNYSYDVKIVGYDSKDKPVVESYPVKIVANQLQEYKLISDKLNSVKYIKVFKVDGDDTKLLLKK